MSARAITLACTALVGAGVVVSQAGGEEPLTLHVPLENASGLKTGAPVMVGGVDRGEVELRIAGDDVVADLEIERDAGPIGRDARVSVTATNFLGQKRVELDPGDRSRPVRSGATVPADRVTTPTDLDQVLAVLDADTRARATILLNELGTAVVGRTFDIRTMLDEFPAGMRDATRVLRQLETDDATMRDLLVRSDRFVTEATARRREITRLVDATGKTAETVAGRRAELRQTLVRAPRTLATLRAFLAELERTTKPLAPAAREITAAAPELTAVLAELPSFTRSARPTLDKATDVAPAITRLADGTTPTLRRSLPTLRRLDAFAQALPGLTDTLDISSDNILAILENWSRAIQFRDGLGHVFRGEASLPPDILLSMLDRLGGTTGRKRPAARKPKAPASSTPGSDAGPQDRGAQDAAPEPDGKKLPDLPPGLPPSVDDMLDDSAQALEHLLGPLTGGAGATTPSRRTGEGLLDFLLAP